MPRQPFSRENPEVLPVNRMPATVLFDEADLESDRWGESDASCSYPPGAQSEVSELRHAEGEQPESSDNRITLRAPAPSSALLELSGLDARFAADASRGHAAHFPEGDEPLRETREPFRLAIRDASRDAWPDSAGRTVRPTPDVEDALRRAARSSFASTPPEPSDRPSGIRISAPHSIEEAILRAVESAEPPPAAKIPKA
jgi:hypothetical protein